MYIRVRRIESSFIHKVLSLVWVALSYNLTLFESDTRILVAATVHLNPHGQAGVNRNPFPSLVGITGRLVWSTINLPIREHHKCINRVALMRSHHLFRGFVKLVLWDVYCVNGCGSFRLGRCRVWRKLWLQVCYLVGSYAPAVTVSSKPYTYLTNITSKLVCGVLWVRPEILVSFSFWDNKFTTMLPPFWQ